MHLFDFVWGFGEQWWLESKKRRGAAIRGAGNFLAAGQNLKKATFLVEKIFLTNVNLKHRYNGENFYWKT